LRIDAGSPDERRDFARRIARAGRAALQSEQKAPKHKNPLNAYGKERAARTAW